MEISVFHNLILTGNESQEVCMFDYEFIKLVKIFELEKNQYPTAFNFISQLPLIVIASNDGMGYIIQYQKREKNYECDVISKIDLEGCYTA